VAQRHDGAVSISAATRPQLPQLSLSEWEATKETLHLWLQIVGKVRMASTAPRNHWWHVPLYVDVRGLTTRRMHAANGVSFEIDFDFIDHRLVITTNNGAVASFELVDGLSVAEFDEKLHARLAGLGIDVTIRETPFGLPTTTPFPADREHASYHRDAVERFWHVLEWTDEVLEEFAGWYCGKTSPVHLFWHGFDLALTRFGGARAPAIGDASLVNREAYSHEVVSFGFWVGDENVREPTYYSYTAPEPAGLRQSVLRPDEAFWAELGSGSLARLPYEAVRMSDDPKTALLGFLESAYQAGAGSLGWDRTGLESSWCPSPCSCAISSNPEAGRMAQSTPVEKATTSNGSGREETDQHELCLAGVPRAAARFRCRSESRAARPVCNQGLPGPVGRADATHATRGVDVRDRQR
jgi:hypothetical protein